ncbi:18401_t:CDS:2, partial [Gigaspora margarita]
LPHGYFSHRPIIIPSLVKFERSRSYLSEGMLDKDLIPSNIDLESLLVQIPKSLVPQNLIKFTNQDLRKAFTYNILKLASKNYQIAKQTLRLQKFCEWIKCPSEIYENFDQMVN